MIMITGGTMDEYEVLDEFEEAQEMCNIPVDEGGLMRVISTKCSEEQQKEDMPELKKLHAQALKTELMWEFFGGTLTLPNGNKYQVVE